MCVCVYAACLVGFSGGPAHSSEELALEQPLEAAILLSLVGAGCVLTNQWRASSAANVGRMTATLKGRWGPHPLTVTLRTMEALRLGLRILFSQKWVIA